MNVQDHIRSIIDQLVIDFPMITCRYEHDTFDDTHYIEVTPSDVYESNGAYHDREVELSEAFGELYPQQMLTFVSAEDHYVVSEPIYVCSGEECEGRASQEVLDADISNKFLAGLLIITLVILAAAIASAQFTVKKAKNLKLKVIANNIPKNVDFEKLSKIHYEEDQKQYAQLNEAA